MSRDLLLTVSIGQDDLSNHTIPRMQRYAAKYRVEFEVMTSSNRFERPAFAYWERLVELVDSEYDRILILDSDILIRNDAPNLFEIDFEDVAMKQSKYVAPNFLARVNDEIDCDFTVPDMYNTGVILITRDYLASISDNIRELSCTVEKTRYADQVYFCVVVKNTGVQPTPLSWRWNQHDQVPDFRARHAYFLHFRGRQKVLRVQSFLQNNQSAEWN